MSSVIEVHGVSKAFRIPSVRRETVREHFLHALQPRRFERLQVLDRVTFEVRRGEGVGIMGRNGSGKSTLLKIMSGVYRPDEGAVIARAPVTPILELGVGWNAELDAVDNILLIGTVMGLRLAEIRAQMDEILAFAELERFANLKLKHYSSGMAERLGYSVAFKAVTDILILDEVLAVGDAGFRARCEQRYLELRGQGHTAIVVSHNPRIISTFCDRAMLIDAGRIVMEGSGTEVVERYSTMLAQGRHDPAAGGPPA